ncbi:glucosyltransferase, partial [Modicella reniformis]
DEIFHIPQAQRYCHGDFWTWDPKLTTPPGLYAISNLLLATKWPLCSTLLLRLTNLVYPIVTLFTTTELLKDIHPHLSRQERFKTAAVIICFPTLYFFNFMYYTDGGSAAFVLISWLAAKRRHHLLAALASAVALPTVLTMTMPYLGLIAGFSAFVKWNGGIVLGDKSNHIPTLHIVQLLYFAAFSAGLSIFAILGTVPLARLLKKPSLRYIIPLQTLVFAQDRASVPAGRQQTLHLLPLETHVSK